MALHSSSPPAALSMAELSITSACYYVRSIPGEYEKEKKETRLKLFDLAQTPCSAMVKKVSLFIDEVGDDVDLHGCASILELLNLRANGESVDESNKDDLDSRTICSNHFETLITNWEKSDSRSKNNRQTRSKKESDIVKCPVPTHKKAVPADVYRVVDKAMCVYWMSKKGILIPPGTTICRRHQGLMKEANAKFRRSSETERDPTVQEPMDIHESDDDLEPMFDFSDPTDDQPPPSTRVEREIPSDAVTAVNQLVRALGGDRLITRGAWESLAEGTKRKKGYLARRIFDAVCEVITPDGKTDLYERATSENRGHDGGQLASLLLDRIDERYAAACTAQEKVEVLSLVTDLGLTQKQIIQLVPSSTLHYLNLAKTHNRGGIDWDTKYKRESKNEKKSDRYVEFLIRSNSLISLPWGDTLTTLSDGSKTTIASVSRKFSFSRIHRLYLRDLEASNEMHLKLGRGSTTRILKVLAKRKNESMKCVDEFAVAAYEGWRQLTNVVEELKESHGLIGNDDERAYKRWIRISRSHLEGEFISEVCESSNVPQHCSRFSLSDSSKKCFSADCDHKHTGHCINCDQLDQLLSNLESLTNQLAGDTASSDPNKMHRIRRLNEIVEHSCKSIRSYQAHVLRTALSNSGRCQILENLQDGHALLTLDFAMKILPDKAIEGQSDFYAKRGICLHISHALAKIDGKLVDHCFAHTLDDVTQNGSLVYSIVRHTLSILEAKGIHTVTLRSDNAGAYKCSSLIAALFHLSTPKMRITGYYYSETQSGKGACDRCTAHCKRKMREWTSSENNICNARDIYEALTVKDETVKGLSTYHCQFFDTSKKSPNAFPGISHFYAFDFEDDGVRARCQFGIGKGRMTEKEKLSTLDCSLDDVEEGGHVGDSFWSVLDSSEKEKKNEEEGCEEVGHSDMLNCSTMGCIRSFRTLRWLSQHERIGVHEFVEKKQSMTDRAVAKFNELIETRESARLAVSEQVEALGEHGYGYEHERGWALKSSHTTYGLDKKAKELAEEYFRSQRAHIPPRRAYPAVMRKKLEEEKDPSDPTRSRYLLEYAKVPSEKQLQSLFSRLESCRLAGPKKVATPVAPKKGATPAAKTPKKPKVAATPNKTNTPSKKSVRTPVGETRKRKIVEESESEVEEWSGGEEDVQEEGKEVFDEKEEDVEDEINEEDEQDFAKRVIEEESDEIFE